VRKQLRISTFFNRHHNPVLSQKWVKLVVEPFTSIIISVSSQHISPAFPKKVNITKRFTLKVIASMLVNDLIKLSLVRDKPSTTQS
jgi:hypothetical protein